MATSYDHITDAVMGEATPEKAGFLQELIENQLEMSSLETAASRAGIAQSSALWAIGIMMVSDTESVRDAAFDRARDNPLDAALVAICGYSVDLAKSAAYFLTGFIAHKAVRPQDVQTISRMVDAVIARWLEVSVMREYLCSLIQQISTVQREEVPLHAAMKLFTAVTDTKQMHILIRAIGELAMAGTRAAGVAESKALPFLRSVHERLQFTVADELRKEICWMLSNLACDGPWAEWMVDVGIHRSLVYMDSARVNAENVGALVNLVDFVKRPSNKEVLRSDIMLTFVLMAHKGRFVQEAMIALTALGSNQFAEPVQISSTSP
jgi:hypothetical protein